MSFDPSAYLGHVADLDMADATKIEMLTALAAIMQSFVDRAFGTAPEQILLGIDRVAGTVESADALGSGDTITSTFNAAAFGRAERECP